MSGEDGESEQCSDNPQPDNCNGMEPLAHIGKFLIITGLIIAVLGVILMLAGKVPFLGRLPGDIIIERKNFTFYFPLATSIILSIILTLILWIIGRIR